MRALKYWVLAALVAAGLASPAGARQPNTQVTIKANGGDFSGEVRSVVPQCRAFRKVTVKKQRPGKDVKIGTDESDTDGSWSTGNSGQTKGKFYAKVKRRDQCSSAKSDTVKL